jgi:hypothetical protein
MPKPLCFMVMPYGRKSTLAAAGDGPTEVDFNRLWDLAYVPVIEALGYEAVRADQDTGSLIITQMLERLYFADLVLADITVPNGNVYYEIGVRHASRETGCVLLAADWSRQLFDVAQLRTVRYPLPEGEVSETTAQVVRAAIADAIPTLGRGKSPMHDAIKGYPSKVDENTASTMKERMGRLAAFQGEVRAVRAAPRAQRMALAQELAVRHAARPLIAPAAITLLRLLGDCADTAADWAAVVSLIDGLPANLIELPEVQEQRALARSYAGQHVDAIAELEKLVAIFGPTPERLGLLGGRYKRLHMSARDAADRDEWLGKAIECYEHGMQLDLNEYYCSSNLARLYRLRNRTGDEERAQSVLRVVIAACERARKRGAVDPWLRPTLLAAAFDAGDADKSEQLADEIRAEGPARWQLSSVRGDLETSIRHVPDEAIRVRLVRVLERLV